MWREVFPYTSHPNSDVDTGFDEDAGVDVDADGNEDVGVAVRCLSEWSPHCNSYSFLITTPLQL